MGGAEGTEGGATANGARSEVGVGMATGMGMGGTTDAGATDGMGIS